MWSCAVAQQDLLQGGLGVAVAGAEAQAGQKDFAAHHVADGQQVLTQVLAALDRLLDRRQRGIQLDALFLHGRQRLVEVDRALHRGVERLAVGAEPHVGEAAAGLQQLFLLAGELLGHVGALLGEDPGHVARGPLVDLVHELEIGIDDRADHVGRHLGIAGGVGDFEDVGGADGLGADVFLQHVDPLLLRSAGQVDPVALAQLRQGPLEDLGAADHGLEGGHGVAP